MLITLFQTGLSGNFIILSVLYYGGTMVSENAITVGALSAFLLYAAYTGVALGGLSSFYSEMMKGIGASTRLWELIDREPTIPLSGSVLYFLNLDLSKPFILEFSYCRWNCTN